MARLTRNSYKRKIIMFGAFVFISIALISTGFAAWVMSSDAQVDQNGNVSVGVVNDASLKIKLTNVTPLEGFTFYFEPAEGDETGRVRLDSENPVTEALKYTITGKITNVEILDKLTIEMILPVGMAKAVELKYIVIPECADSTKEITVEEDGTFEYVLEFKWGETFKSMNPSLYYDTDTDGLEISDAMVKETLENLRACVYNYYDELNADGADRSTIIAAHEADEMPTFKVTIVAKAN